MSRKTEEQIKEETEKYFRSLNLEGWTLSGNHNSGGQAAIMEVKGPKGIGVFRRLLREDETSIKRFKRELAILENSEFKSPYIVDILASSALEPNHWYISKKGVSFSNYWDNACEKYKEEPNKLVELAIKIVKELCTGLVKLHKEGVIHRDIKMSNIVMQGDTPQLIDFGIAYIDGEDRLTPLERAAANKRSHQLQLQYGDVPPWLDVFLFSQLLISMLSENPLKNWQRPLDWRWVLYPKDMSELNVNKLRALTAVCANPSTSPKDAEELIMYIDSLFSEKKKSKWTT